jgi:DNA-directed RNA polymerase I subunit RPA49
MVFLLTELLLVFHINLSLQNMQNMRNDLGQTFGTKKARKAIASLTENAISSRKPARQTSPGSTSHVELDSAAKLILSTIKEATNGMATLEELSAAIDDSKPRPKANLAAEKVNDVYTIENVIGVEILRLLPVKEWQDTIKAKKEVITHSRFVAHRLQGVATDVQKLRALRYLLCLLEFFRAARRKGRETRAVPKKEELRTALSGIPDVVVESIRRKFSVQGLMHKYQVDLLITHTCVLALLVDNFDVDMYDLMEDLQLEAKQISQYFREVGARVSVAGEVERKRLGLDRAAAAQHKIAKLKLPLEFPKAKFMRKK